MSEYLFEPQRPYQSPFVKSSYTVLPHSRDNFNSTNVPFFISVTPLAADDFGEDIPIMPQPCQLCARCPFCNAYANPFTVDKKICNICGEKIDSPKRTLFAEQEGNTNYDMRFPPPESIVKTPGKKIKNINYENMIFTIIIELSKTMKESGVYDRILDDIKKEFADEEDGYISIFVFNNGMYVPNIQGEEEDIKFSISKICDIEDAVFYPTDNLLFSLDGINKLFNEYIDELKKLTPAPVTTTVYDVLKAVSIISDDEILTPSIVFSEAQPGDREKLKELASNSLRATDAADLFAIQPQEIMNDFSPLAEYSCIMSSKFNVYSMNETDLPKIVSNDLIYRINEPHFFGASYFFILPECLKLVDIYGSGIRIAAQSFSMSSLCPGDTVYAEIDYNAKYLPAQVDIQVQARFKDTRLRRYIRTFNLRLMTSSDMINTFNMINFDVFVAGILTRGMSAGRVNGEATRKAALKSEADRILEHQQTVINIRRQLTIRQNRIYMCLALAKDVLNDINTARIFGQSPEVIVGFLAPKATQLSLDGFPYESEMIAGMIPRTGVFFVKGGDGHSYIFVDEKQDFDAWLKAMSTEGEALARQVAELAGDDYTQIVSPLRTPQHPLIQYTYKLMNALR